MAKYPDLKKYTEANRLAWNEVTPVHRKARKKDYRKEFKKKGYSTLDDLITSKLKDIPIAGKDIAQVCCNNGSETLSIASLGTKSAVGFDISDEAIKEARDLAEISGLNCSFIRTDTYDIGEEYYNRFDMIYISIGALAWMPDLDCLFKVISKMLKTDGTLVIYESHPFLYVFADEGEDDFDPDNPAKIAYSYFKEDPWVNDDGIDYIGKSQYKSKVNYCFTYKVSDVINAVIKSGIRLIEFNEYSHNISSEYERLAETGNLPFCYIMIGKKE